MAELKHIKTFESYSTPEVDADIELVEEGLFDSLKSRIDKYLENPTEGKEDKILASAFAKSFGASPAVKKDVLGLSHDEKVNILKKASAKLEDKRIGVLKIQKKPSGEYAVGGVPVKGGTGGGMNA